MLIRTNYRPDFFIYFYKTLFIFIIDHTNFKIWSKTAKTPAGKAKCRNPLGRIVRVSSAQARGKRSCFTEYPHNLT